ncbi:DEAD/DEAH box helicase family protein [Streptomyces sp. NPDC059568]|uniref:DEAD/DEAH box helicase family protein n=1 Tax=Streptomyces sp. NPDC059568 TaxID=3346868 RepID=UPI00367EB5BF
MPKDHARKSSARRRAARTGSSYTSANARTVHEAPTPTVWLAGRSWPHGLEQVLRDGERRLTLAMPAGGGKTTVAASGLGQAQPTAKTLLLVPDAAALCDVIKTWSLHCNNPIATLKVVAVGQDSTAALATARDVAVWMAAQQGGAILVACHDDAEVIASSHLDHQLPPWDQMVIEEAHRTAAEPVAADHPYAAIHYDDAIPAFARLYLTATPQILPTPTASDGEVSDGSVDMPGNQLFGHIQSSVSRTELVRKGLLSPYRIDVLAVPDLAHFPRMRAAAIAAAHAIEHHSLRRIVSIHSTRGQAQHFALQLATQLLDAEIIVSPGRRTSDTYSQPVIWCQCPTDPCPQDIDTVVLADTSCTAVQLTDGLTPLMRQRHHLVGQTSVVVPIPIHPDADGEDPESLLQSPFLDRVFAALKAHDPAYAEAFRNTRDR